MRWILMNEQEQILIKSKELKTKIKSLHEQVAEKTSDKTKQQDVSLGVAIMSDLLGGIIAGAAIGFLIQQFFDTKPFVLGIFIFLGGIAGILNVYKYVRRAEKRENK